MSEKGKILIKNALITLAFPAAIYLIVEIICAINGTHIIQSMLDVRIIVQNVAVCCLTAYALSFNLTCGRMDLSLGSQRLIGVIMGGNLAILLGLKGLSIVLFSVFFGFLFGALTGLLFVVTKVPAMVLGIGVGLVYEALSWEFTGLLPGLSPGNGLNLFGVDIGVLSEIWFLILIVIVMLFFVMFLIEKTTYGYHLRAIQGSQKISKAAGVNVYLNAILSYTFAGGLVATAGTIKAAADNGLAGAKGFTSNGTTMSNMFPMFLGMYIARWSNQAIGILVGALCIQFINKGMAVMSLFDYQQNVILMTLFLLFLIFLANEQVFKIKKAEKERIELARKRKEELGLI